MRFWTVFLVFLAILRLVSCSAGDRDQQYVQCVERCDGAGCRGNSFFGVGSLRSALGWTCRADCQYNCMHSVTTKRLARGQPVLQYHGKWPFYRLWKTVQEPASVVFSLLNLGSNVIGILQFRRSSPVVQYYPLYHLWHVHALLSCSAWLWSTVFHTRDLVWTERMDYFSATAVVLFSIFCSLARTVLLFRPKQQVTVGFIMTTMFGAHVYYLAMVKFDYGYNMKANILVAFINMLLWLIWSFKNFYQRPYVWKCVATILLGGSFMMLELFDFPPIWFTFDAHSLWHLSTVPLPLLWYSFLVDDAADMIRH